MSDNKPGLTKEQEEIRKLELDHIKEQSKLKRIKEIDRVLDGNSNDDLISKMINIDNELERTMNPNLGFVLFNAYIQAGVNRFSQQGKALDNFGKDIRSGMIAYKDERMKQVVEATKKAPEMVTITPQEPKQEPNYGKIFNRKPKGEFD